MLGMFVQGATGLTHGGKLSKRNFVQLDEASEAQPVSTVSLELSRLIQQARVARGMKQAELAKIIHERPAVVNAALPSMQR